jgi:hypothetical protein
LSLANKQTGSNEQKQILEIKPFAGTGTKDHTIGLGKNNFCEPFATKAKTKRKNNAHW